MATFLDLAFFHGLTPVFMFFLVFAVVYSILQMTGVFGSSKSMHAIISFVIGIFVAISSKTTAIVITMIPWFVILFIFLLMVVIAFKSLGVKDESFTNAGTDSSVRWTILIVFAIIVVGSIASVFGQSQLEITSEKAVNATGNVNNGGTSQEGTTVNNGKLTTNTGSFSKNLGATLYHPRVLGFILVIVIGTLTVSMLTRA